MQREDSNFDNAHPRAVVVIKLYHETFAGPLSQCRRSWSGVRTFVGQCHHLRCSKTESRLGAGCMRRSMTMGGLRSGRGTTQSDCHETRWRDDAAFYVRNNNM